MLLGRGQLLENVNFKSEKMRHEDNIKVDHVEMGCEDGTDRVICTMASLGISSVKPAGNATTANTLSQYI